MNVSGWDGVLLEMGLIGVSPGSNVSGIRPFASNETHAALSVRTGSPLIGVLKAWSGGKTWQPKTLWLTVTCAGARYRPVSSIVPTLPGAKVYVQPPVHVAAN